MPIKIKLTLCFILILIGFFASVSFSQAATNVYYSVGQNTNNHSSGGNVSITSGVATFSVPQTATNLGVGDVLTAGGNTYYLSSKISTTQWNVVTNLGATPADLGSTAVTSIAHAFQYLSAALPSGAGGAKALLGNANLTTLDIILNIACYYDSAADPNIVTVSGWTTDATRYIRIYTPSNTATEANQSQRHSGKWDATKYRLEISSNATVVQIDDAHVRIDGLQIYAQGSGDWSIGISGGGAGGPDVPGEIMVSNSIIRGNNPVGANCRGVNIRAAAAGDGTVAKIWNNVIYDWGASGLGLVSSDPEVDYHYAYNNTIVDNSFGISHSAGSFVAKNNLVKGSGNTNAYAGTFASGTDYNATDGTDNIGQGSNNKTSISTTNLFVNEAGDDFHLTANTTSDVKDGGTNLSADSYLSFSTDIDSQARTTGAWDIGADEYVASGNFTLSMWVKPSVSIATKALVGKTEELRLATNGSGQPLCQIRSDGAWQTAVTSSSAITVDNWAQVICTYDRVALRIYVDGVLKGEQALTAAPDDTSNVFEIGHDASNSSPYGYYSGLVDQYRFFASAMTAEDVKREYNNGKSMRLGSAGATSGTGASTNAASGEYCVPGDTTACAAPVGEWKLDEKTGSTVYDTSGNGNNGTLGGTFGYDGPEWTQGKFGSGLEFSGASSFGDNITINDPGAGSVLDITGAVTMEAWFKPRDVTNADYSVIIAKGNSSTNNYYLGHTSAGKLVATFYSGGAWRNHATTSDMTLNQWNHLVGIIDSDNDWVKLYINGREVLNEAETNNMVANDIAITIGDMANDAELIGTVDQVRIYNYARTPAQIAWEYNKGKPVAHWKMDECQGDDIHDESGNGNHGTIQLGASGQTASGSCTASANTPWYNGRSGKFGASLNFDGTSDSVSVTDQGNLCGMRQLTVSCWFKIGTGNRTQQLLSHYGPYQLAITWENKVQFSTTTGSTITLTSDEAVPTGSWVHLLGTYDGSTMKMYVNGNYQKETAQTGVIQDNHASYGVYIGNNYNGNYFSGQIDDVRVYNFPLTEEQIQQVLNESVGIRF